MSGGVDSSVTAALLKEQGYEVVGMTMQLWNSQNFSFGLNDEDKSDRPSDAVTEARKVAEQLNIPFHAVNFADDFRAQVINPFCEDYYAGRTPNPCVICNKKLKFGLLLEKALELGADYLATGHYVNLEQNEGRYLIRKGVDHNKDQSYFLFALTQPQLERCLFPLGEFNKQQVRAYAAKMNLQVAEKSESQDICFIPDGEYVKFLEHECGSGRLSGEIVHVSGRVLGLHQGVYRYTIGQRKGLGIGWTEPLFVVGIDVARKQVIVGEKQHLNRPDLIVAQCTWSIPQPTETLSTKCRIRYRHTEVPAKVEPLTEDQVRVVFESPQSGITPGQAAVFYEGDRVIGGGWIQ